MPNGDENELSPVTDVNLMDPNDHDATLLKPPGSINHLTTHKFYISSKPRKNFNLTQQPIQAVKQMERTAEKKLVAKSRSGETLLDIWGCVWGTFNG